MLEARLAKNATAVVADVTNIEIAACDKASLKPVITRLRWYSISWNSPFFFKLTKKKNSALA